MYEYLLDHSSVGLRLAKSRQGRIEAFDFEGGSFPLQLRHSLYLGRVVDVLKAGHMAFVDIGLEQPGILPLKEKKLPPVSRGETVLCQITREHDQSEDKGVHLSRNVTLSLGPVMYTPFTSGCNTSKRLRDPELAAAFKEHVKEGEGVILRQWADCFDLETLLHILDKLRQEWREVEANLEEKPSVCLKRAPSLLDRLVNQLEPGDSITCNHKPTAQALDALMLESYGGGPEVVLEKGSLFHDDILDEWDSLTQTHIAVPEGGEIIIEETAALVSIDINNSGAHATGHDLNRRALKEIFRQIQLRNLAGIIVVDLAGNIKHPKQLIQSARSLADSDTHVHGITDLGLLEISRRKSGPSLTTVLQ